MKLKDKVAIVTGSGKGIGEGIARVFSQEGAIVVVACRTESEGNKVADELGQKEGRALYIRTDVSNSKSIFNMIETTVDKFGKIDVLVNNAGYHLPKNIIDTSEEEWDSIIDTNLKSTFFCSKFAVPYLTKTKGTIINMSSMVGIVGQPAATAYCASKGGQIAMTKNMAIDLAQFGIRVNAICPGWIHTPGVDHHFSIQKDPEAEKKYIFGQHPLGRIGTPEECGRLAVFLATDESSFITGTAIEIDGGVTLGY